VRARELVILRTGLNAGSGYEWAQHVAIARRFGCTDLDIERVAEGPSAMGWPEAERALLAATDELMADDFVSDPTWIALRGHWSEQQCIDLVFTVGQYRLVAMALNTFGVQIEDGVDRFPARLFDDGGFNGR
jgi:alkylhydroperoxidase family enzyme